MVRVFSRVIDRNQPFIPRRIDISFFFILVIELERGEEDSS